MLIQRPSDHLTQELKTRDVLELKKTSGWEANILGNKRSPPAAFSHDPGDWEPTQTKILL